MTAAVRACVLSLSAAHPDGRDAEYSDWHIHDHLPEQYSIEQVVHGERWRAADPLTTAAHAVQYLFADPVAPALDRFFELGAELRNAGRMPIALPPVELAAYAFESCTDPVAPWRPCQGVYLAISDAPLQIELNGVQGVWSYSGGRFHDRFADTSGRYLTVCYLQDDPAALGNEIAREIGEVIFGAPFVSVV